MNDQPLAHLLWILPLAVLVLYIGSPRFLGTVGLARVRRLLDHALPKSRYTSLHDLTLPSGGGTMHFDHIVVSQFGIHVIENVRRSGWISGTEVQARWRQRFLGKFRHFENPVHANFLHVQVLERLLQLPLSRFHPVVVFSGHRGFKTAVPGNVVSMQKLIRKIRADSRQLLTPQEADQVILKLQSSILKPGLFGRSGRWKLLRFMLLLVLIGGVFLVYGDAIKAVLLELQRQADVSMAPEKHHADGSAKSADELWEESLICAYSVDTGKCVCYEPAGGKASIGGDRCRALAQRGSILQQ